MRACRTSRWLGSVRDSAHHGCQTACISRFVVRRSRDAPDPCCDAATGTRSEEAVRALKPGGRIAVFDKFLRDEEHPTLKRQLLNAIAKPLFSDLNRRLGPLIAVTQLVIEHDEPVAFGGTYHAVTRVKLSE